MSIKLYKGFRQPRVSMENLLESLMSFRSDALETISKFYKARVLTEAVLMYDDYHYRGIERQKKTPMEKDLGRVHPYQEAVNLIEGKSRRIVSENRRDPENDFQLAIVFIPFGAYIYSIVYSENFVNLWKNQDHVTPYPYWDNTDPPENFTRKDWEERGNMWGEVLRGWKPPGQVGLTYEVSDVEYVEIGQTFKSLSQKEGLPKDLTPSFVKRVKRLSHDLAWIDYVERHNLNDPENSTDVSREYLRWKREESEVDEKPYTKKLTSIMKKEFSWEDLLVIGEPPTVPFDKGILSLP